MDWLATRSDPEQSLEVRRAVADDTIYIVVAKYSPFSFDDNVVINNGSMTPI